MYFYDVLLCHKTWFSVMAPLQETCRSCLMKVFTLEAENVKSKERRQVTNENICVDVSPWKRIRHSSSRQCLGCGDTYKACSLHNGDILCTLSYCYFQWARWWYEVLRGKHRSYHWLMENPCRYRSRDRKKEGETTLCVPVVFSRQKRVEGLGQSVFSMPFPKLFNVKSWRC